MATKNIRLSIPLDQAFMSSLTWLAERKQKTVPDMAKELLLEALDQREDEVLSVLADGREAKPSKRFSHEDAWK
jgi:hypothetical protein